MKKNLYSFIAVTLSAVFYGLGLYFPLFVTSKGVWGVKFSTEYIRLFDSVKIFYEHNDYLLAGIIFIFTIVLPIVKYLDLFNRILNVVPLSEKSSHFLHKIDKWSMIDVFLVALLLLNIKMDLSLIEMKLKAGTTYIALSVIFRMIGSELLNSKYKIRIVKNE